MFDCAISLTVNGARHDVTVPVRQNLADFLRQTLRLTGTHVGCEHGVCGACTVLLDGRSVRACLVLAVQCDGTHVRTVESLTMDGAGLDPIQDALSRHHGLQCGFCTPGVVMTLVEMRERADESAVDEETIRHALSGNLCRCTGYQGMVDAALELFAPERQQIVEGKRDE
jgi:aerobic-type carbon monoxide dehydrogenase small subunit (CoxS/CutS family)